MPGVGWVMQRMMASLSICSAVLVSKLVNWMPGTRVRIGRKGLACSLGMSGLGSKVSICDRPPCSKSTRTRFARAGRPDATPGPGIASDDKPATPNPMKLRRFTGMTGT